jgi:hypothetical protein
VQVGYFSFETLGASGVPGCFAGLEQREQGSLTGVFLLIIELKVDFR